MFRLPTALKYIFRFPPKKEFALPGDIYDYFCIRIKSMLSTPPIVEIKINV